MKLMTALVDVALTLSINLDNIQRQYEAERMKTKRASEKLDNLTSKRQELEENMEDIRTMLGYLFKSIFVHRYRDSVAEIRSTCMSEIGTWMKRFPNHFLDDSYLKYVGWTLHDKVGDVRLKCLQALLPLYDNEDIAKKMELFTNKFKDRIVQMTLDKEWDVAVQAVKLLCHIHKYHPEVLSDKDCEHIYELVFSTHRSVAQAAGEFLSERNFQIDANAAPMRSKRGKKMSVHAPLIRDLVQFFIESELHEHGAYLVDSLIDSHAMMKDWECMTDLIMEDFSSEDDRLDDKQESCLIEVMVCCIKQAATGEPPVGRGANRRQLSAKESKQIENDKVRISEHFIQTLPLLLDKYKADAEKIANLITVPQHFIISYFTQNQDSLDTLLKLLHEIVEIHSDPEVLEGAAKTYEYLHDEGFTFSRNVWLARTNLFDVLTAKYRESTDRYFSRGTKDQQNMATLALKKIAIFYACHDLSISSTNLWEDIFDKWIREANKNPRDIPTEAVKHAIEATHMGLIWELHHISEARNAVNSNAVKHKLDQFMNQMKGLMQQENKTLEEEAFLSICDLLIVFSHRLENESPGVAPLVYKADRSLFNLLEEFVNENVFVEEETENEEELQERSVEKIEHLAKKRHFLSAYSKLIVYNILPVKAAACVIKNYVRYYHDFGDIIKTTLGKTREINKTLCAKTMATALIDLFMELRAESSGNPQAFTKQDENFQALKELAKRFALSFGLDNQKNRNALAAIHRLGIQFTFTTIENPDNPLGQPPNLNFLEVLCEFSNKLIKPDKKAV
jgi:cohesin complex subunit SA-1/2